MMPEEARPEGVAEKLPCRTARAKIRTQYEPRSLSVVSVAALSPAAGATGLSPSDLARLTSNKGAIGVGSDRLDLSRALLRPPKRLTTQG